MSTMRFSISPTYSLRLTAKAEGGDKHPLAGPVQIQGASEGLDLGTTHGLVAVALGLQVDGVEAKPVFLDDAIDTAVAAIAGGLPGLLIAAAISHGHHQIDHQLFEEARGKPQDLGQQVIGKGVIDGGQRLLNLLLGGLACSGFCASAALGSAAGKLPVLSPEARVKATNSPNWAR